MPAAKPQPQTIPAEIDLGQLLGSTWDGYYLLPGDHTNGYQGRLKHSHWRRPFEAGELSALFWLSQEIHMHRHNAEQLRREVEQAHERAEQAEADAAFYRHELRYASKLGLMFSALAQD
jgi:GAF domain-containing protein